jgi:hypothetical protein
MAERIGIKIRPADTFYEESLLHFKRSYSEFLMPAYQIAMQQGQRWEDELTVALTTPLAIRFRRAANGEYFLHDDEDGGEHSFLQVQDETKYKGPERFIYSKDRKTKTSKPRILQRTRSILLHNLYLSNTEDAMIAMRLIQHQETGWCYQERRLRKTPGGILHPIWDRERNATAEQFDFFANLLEQPKDTDDEGNDDNLTPSPLPNSPLIFSR